MLRQNSISAPASEERQRASPSGRRVKSSGQRGSLATLARIKSFPRPSRRPRIGTVRRFGRSLARGSFRGLHPCMRGAFPASAVADVMQSQDRVADQHPRPRVPHDRTNARPHVGLEAMGGASQAGRLVSPVATVSDSCQGVPRQFRTLWAWGFFAGVASAAKHANHYGDSALFSFSVVSHGECHAESGSGHYGHSAQHSPERNDFSSTDW